MYFKQFRLAYVHSLNVKTDLFQVIQLSISTQFSSMWLIDRILSGATSLGLSGPGSDGNEEVLYISQSSGITGSSPSDCLVSYPGHLLVGSRLIPLQRSSQCILQPQPTGQEGQGGYVDELMQCKYNGQLWLEHNAKLFTDLTLWQKLKA